MTAVTFTVDSSQLPVGPQGPQGVPGKDGATGAQGPQGAAGISPVIDMAALAAAVAAILGTPVVVPPPVVTPPVTTPTGSSDLKVSGTKILNPDGTEFRIRGVDICHFDSGWSSGLPNSGANAARIFAVSNFESYSASRVAGWANTMIADKIVPILCDSVFQNANENSSGDNSATDLASGVAWWVTNAPTLKDIHPMILNVANEWLSGTNAALWQSSYIDAVTKIRAAGYTQVIMIDTDNFGQGIATLSGSAPAAVIAADPLKNVCFGYHVYGGNPDAATLTKNLASCAKYPVVVAEFGPGRNIGPSPTNITPAQVVAACEAAGMGYCAWAWDDNNLANGQSNDSWFSMTTGTGGGNGTYDGKTASQLTTFGQTMVPLLKASAVKSTLFKG